MRCFACDEPSGAQPFIDPKTSRCYCSTCWNAIQEDLGYTGSDKETSEIETDDFDPYELQNDDNYADFNLPTDED